MVNSAIHIPPESDDLLVKGAQHFVLNIKKPWEQLVIDILTDFEKSDCFKFWGIELSGLEQELVALPMIDRSYARIIDAIYRHHASVQEKSISLWGDKTPYLIYHLDWLKLIFPNALYIHIIRDGRAVVHSMMSKQKYTLKKAAVRWRDSIQLSNKHLVHVGTNSFLQIRYEDLINNTESTLREVCKLLNAPFTEGMLHEIPQKMGDTILPHHENVGKPLKKNLVDDWRIKFTKDELSYLNKVLSKELAALKYND